MQLNKVTTFAKQSFWSLVLLGVLLCLGVYLDLFVHLIPLAEANSHVGGGTTQPTNSVKLLNPLENNGITSIPGLLATVLRVVQIIAVPIVVLFIIYAGFLYVTARGKTEQITQAHRALLYALLGGVLIIASSALIQIVQSTVEQF